MSKSKGNFYTVRDVLEGRVTSRPVDPAVLRFELLKAHYRSNLNFTRKGLEDSASAVRKLRGFHAELTRRVSDARQRSAPDEHRKLSPPVLTGFAEALADDLNISAALAVVFSWVKDEHRNAAESLGVLEQVDRVLGVLDPVEAFTVQKTDDEAAGDDPVAIACAEIDKARAMNNYQKADALRQQLIDQGYEVHTNKEGTSARQKLA